MDNSAAFLVTNSSGRHINLLNDNQEQQFTALSPPSSVISDENNLNNDLNSGENQNSNNNLSSSSSKRKYHCTEPGCTKSFTTSGHLARHNRIHTGEKNFPCLFPGCQSRFSRQDNMMQHYRTHMSPKSRRTQKKIISEDLHPRPRLHAHQRIRSDPYRVERPLTIDQHLNNYRRSLLSHHPSSTASSVKYNMPIPLGSVAASNHIQRQQLQQPQQPQQQWAIEPVASHQYSQKPEKQEPQQTIEEDEEEQSITPSSEELPTPSPTTSGILFYQHKPLTFTTEMSIKNKSSLPFTLLHPTRTSSVLVTNNPAEVAHYNLNEVQPQSATTTERETASLSTTSASPSSTENKTSSSQAGLLQLAHIVSTFG